MTLRDIAYKNIKGNFNKYVMYYLSNTLVVMVFFIFANFITNPSMSKLGSLGMKGALTKEAMVMCEIVILVFTFFFTNYSISNFLKTREKEFGLLSMFGLTKTQIRNYIMYENIIVTIISIATGLLLGMVFSKLFFMAITVIMVLNVDMPFVISIKAILITFFSFLLLFQGICFFGSLRIKNNNIAELLRGARVPKPMPKFSPVKTALALIFIGIGYGLAAFSGVMIILTMFPILFFTVLGTYFLYSQFSIYFTNRLKKNKRVFYNGTNIISLSQMIYKLSDNAKVLFIVSVLGAVTLTASASVYSTQQSLKAKIEENYPQDISYVDYGMDDQNKSLDNIIKDTLNKHGYEISHENEVKLIKAKNILKSSDKEKINVGKSFFYGNTRDFYLVSNSDYNILTKKISREPIVLAEGEVLVHSYSHNAYGIRGERKLFNEYEYLNISIGDKDVKYKLINELNGGIINFDNKETNMAVISDKDFNELYKSVKDGNKVIYHGYNIKNWQKSTEAVKEIIALISENQRQLFTERVMDFSEMMQTMTFFLFIGTFIAILFFIATGSIIYFKMFNEIQKDRQEFISLKKIGMANYEMNQVINIQTLIIFFLPYVVTFTHSAFAITALSNLLTDDLTVYFLTIAGVYFLFQTIYYIFAKTMYMRQIKNMGIY